MTHTATNTNKAADMSMESKTKNKVNFVCVRIKRSAVPSSYHVKHMATTSRKCVLNQFTDYIMIRRRL